MQVFRCPNGYRVGIVNRWTVESLDATTESAPDTILISIHGSRDQKARVSAPFRDILFLRFDDLDKPLAGYRLMSEGDAQAVLDFISRNKDSDVLPMLKQQGFYGRLPSKPLPLQGHQCSLCTNPLLDAIDTCRPDIIYQETHY